MSIATRHPLNSGTAIKRQRGLTLIEVLVTMTILSVGLLGVAGLQGMTKRSTHQAYQRTLATQLVDGIIERVRANPSAAASYHTGTSAPLGNASRGNTRPSPDCSSGNACTDAQLATHDLWSWEQAIDGAAVTKVINGSSTRTGGLMSSRGCIVFTADAGKTNTGTMSVILSWDSLTDISDAVEAGDTVCGSVAANTDGTRRQAVVNTFIFDDTE